MWLPTNSLVVPLLILAVLASIIDSRRSRNNSTQNDFPVSKSELFFATKKLFLLLLLPKALAARQMRSIPGVTGSDTTLMAFVSVRFPYYYSYYNGNYGNYYGGMYAPGRNRRRRNRFRKPHRRRNQFGKWPSVKQPNRNVPHFKQPNRKPADGENKTLLRVILQAVQFMFSKSVDVLSGLFEKERSGQSNNKKNMTIT